MKSIAHTSLGPPTSGQDPRALHRTGAAPVTVESVVCLLEDGLDPALSLGDAEAAVEAIRLEVAAAVAAELE